MHLLLEDKVCPLLPRYSIYLRVNSVFADVTERSFSMQTIESKNSNVVGVIACFFVAAAFVALIAFDFQRLRSAAIMFEENYHLSMKEN